MTDPKKPPPLPPRPVPGWAKSFQQEPFPPAPKSEPPPGQPQVLADTPAPDARRTNSTPPSGSLMLSHLVDQLSEDPREQLIKDQALTIKLYQQRVTELSQMPNTAPSPVPTPPRSKAIAAGKVGLNIGKYTALVSGVLALADVIVGLWFPQYSGPLTMLKSLVGIP